MTKATEIGDTKGTWVEKKILKEKNCSFSTTHTEFSLRKKAQRMCEVSDTEKIRTSLHPSNLVIRIYHLSHTFI